MRAHPGRVRRSVRASPAPAAGEYQISMVGDEGSRLLRVRHLCVRATISWKSCACRRARIGGRAPRDRRAGPWGRRWPCSKSGSACATSSTRRISKPCAATASSGPIAARSTPETLADIATGGLRQLLDKLVAKRAQHLVRHRPQEPAQAPKECTTCSRVRPARRSSTWNRSSALCTTSSPPSSPSTTSRSSAAPRCLGPEPPGLQHALRQGGPWSARSAPEAPAGDAGEGFAQLLN